MMLLDLSFCVVHREEVGQHCWNDWLVLEREGGKVEALAG